MKTSSYTYKFKRGIMTISRGITTKFDWRVGVKLNNDADGTKNLISLDQNIFLTRKHAKLTTEKLLAKYNLL